MRVGCVCHALREAPGVKRVPPGEKWFCERCKGKCSLSPMPLPAVYCRKKTEQGKRQQKKGGRVRQDPLKTQLPTSSMTSLNVYVYAHYCFLTAFTYFFFFFGNHHHHHHHHLGRRKCHFPQTLCKLVRH